MYGANSQQNLAVIVSRPPVTKRTDKGMQHFGPPPVAQKQQKLSGMTVKPTQQLSNS